MDAGTKKWIERNKNYTLNNGKLKFTLNVAGMNFTEKQLNDLKPKFRSAHAEMRKLEAGEIKNPDENRKVTHFTDRAEYSNSELFNSVEEFAEEVRQGKIKGSTGGKLEYVIINGIGGSALGPQLMQYAINGPFWNELNEEKRSGYPRIYFTDNTDPAGVQDVLSAIEPEKTLMVNISKSGGTQETKNNMAAFSDAFEKRGLQYAKHACAITMEDSQLDKQAKSEGWLKIFHMAESIGGRTSETSIVGHLPAALAGIDFSLFLKGACEMDVWTREPEYKKNPAYLLAAMWYISGNGRGDRNMVIVPYSDRLVLLSRYFQQLVMESLGKEKDLDGKVVNQGMNVFGNKGGTDAHAFIQQLNDGRNDFFLTFIEVLKDAMDIPLPEKVSMGDFLHGFEEGLASALINKKREVIKIQIDEVNEFNLGMIIALYERAVAVYAELININAFHQPGVQAYKLASKGIIQLTLDIKEKLAEIAPFEGTVSEISRKTGFADKEIEVRGLLVKFAENNDKRDFEGFEISRTWDAKKGWIYKVTDK